MKRIAKRVVYLATAALVAVLISMSAALAQDAVPGDDHPHLPEPNVVAVGSHEELEQKVGQPIPSPNPGPHPEPVPAASPQGFPKSGGPSVTTILPAAGLLLVGSGVLTCAALWRRGSR